MYILGISCFYHESAACLIKDGKIIGASAEERFSRKKHDSDFPKQTIDFCLKKAGITMNQIDYVVFYEIIYDVVVIIIMFLIVFFSNKIFWQN